MGELPNEQTLWTRDHRSDLPSPILRSEGTWKEIQPSEKEEKKRKIPTSKYQLARDRILPHS